MIPKTIHYCWYGNKPLDSLQTRCLDSWKRHLPDFTIKKWSESNSPVNAPYARQSLNRGLWAQLANFVRLHALYHEGGIYLDTDVEVVKSFNALLHENCFVGFQQEKKSAFWVNNAVIGSVPGHPFVGKCIDLTVEGLKKRRHWNRGPVILTKVLLDMGLERYGPQKVGDVRLFPTEYFYPCPWWKDFASDCVTENTFCIHHWQMTWVRREDGKLSLTWWLGRKCRKALRTYAGI